MGKSMMNEVVLLLVLVFCQSCCATAYSGCPIRQPNCRGDYNNNKDFNCTSPHGLPCDEAYGLRDFIKGLRLPALPGFGREKCNALTPSINVTCSCTTNSENISICHINHIVALNNDLRDGIIHENVSKLSYLQTLDLSGNNLGGNIPNSIGNLTNLVILYLYMNFLSGQIPPSLGNLELLLELDLSLNRLSGEIPKELGKLSNLEYIDLGENELNGTLPSELGDLTNLKFLWLGSNNLTGSLPETYLQLLHMKMFSVAGNNLSGAIPNFISQWKNLSLLHLIGNNFEGNLPLEIFQMSNLEDLEVSDVNSSTEDFHFPEKANLTNIETLVLNCSISGYIPKYIGQWRNLRYLDLSFNNLTGSLPDSLRNVPTLLLTRNRLEGQIPSWINEEDNKTDLSYNNFQNPSPMNSKNYNAAMPIINYTLPRPEECDSKHDNLFINCGGGRNNDYDEDISKRKWYISKGNRWAYTCSGNFISNIPVENSSFYIENKTCGVSDNSLVDSARLCPTSLTYYGFCLHKGKYNVTLTFAEIVFAKDEDYSSILKRVFDVYIQGKKKLVDFNIKKEAGGPNVRVKKWFEINVDNSLLVINFFWAGKGSSYYLLPTLNGPLVSAISVTKFKTSGNRLSATQIVGIAVGSALAPILLLVVLWKMGWLGKTELQKVHIEVQGRRFSLQQIIDATRNFSPKTEIGGGRFGMVYMADLSDNNHKIKLAVKKISPDSMQDKLKIELLKGEIFNLKSLKHENLIQLFDGYSKKELHLLIYEYMENGSIHKALLDPTSTIVLDWKVRSEICLGLAKALKYLHEENASKILHGNLKASNILLDGSYTAKLTDFGWARLYNEEDPFSTIKAGAARVYIAPEYAMGRPISEKADVYSYGVVALEVFSGRPAIENKPNQEAAYLIDDARIAHAHGRIYELVDRKMENYDRKVAFTVLNLAIMCIHPTAALRPTMSEVVSVLSGEKTLEQISKVHAS